MAAGSTALLFAGLWRPKEVAGRVLLLGEPRRAATSLMVSLGSS